VVVVASAGLRVVLDSVVVVVVRVDGSCVSFTVVQADSETMATAAMHEIMSVFIGNYIWEMVVSNWFYVWPNTNGSEELFYGV